MGRNAEYDHTWYCWVFCFFFNMNYAKIKDLSMVNPPRDLYLLSKKAPLYQTKGEVVLSELLHWGRGGGGRDCHPGVIQWDKGCGVSRSLQGEENVLLFT